MLRGMHSPDSNDSRVRQLLDERSGHTDGLRYSEGEDTPSVYSTAFFSPRQTDKPSSSSRLLDDPSSSVLDFDEDIRSSMALSVAFQDEIQDQDDTSDSDSLTRMSYLGPKMRFHSRAPWELEEDALQDADETASTAHSTHSGLMGILSRGKAYKSDSSSRPSTATSRPSAESSHSFLNPKRSFDTSMSSSTHPRGALYALAQESLSTSSLGRPHHSERQEGLRGKFSLGRLRSHSSTLEVPSSPNDSAIRLPSPISPSPRASCDTTNSSTLDVQTGLNALFVDRHIDKGFHPYASPELVSYALEPPLPPKSPVRSNPQYTDVPRKDSSSTVVEVSAFSGAAKLLTSNPAPETSKRRVSHIQGKEISGPVNVLLPDSPIQPQPDEPIPLPRTIPGWTERNINPGFSLISLEEARAQRRGTALPSPKTKTHQNSSSGDSSTTTAVETSISLASDANHSEFAAARARARSISAGAKAKNVLSSLVKPPERRGSENVLVTGPEASNAKDATAAAIAAKNLKHKKSGFMRLFSNGKANEKEPPPVLPPPSTPSLPQYEAPAFTPRHNPKLSSHRIPVPSLSPSLLEAASRLEGTLEFSDSDVIDVSRSAVNSRRSPPRVLSISTTPSPLQISPRGRFAGFRKDDSLPQSAPPGVGDFPALKLRPVSTLFSAHFGDHIDVTKLNFDEEENVGPTDTREDIMARRRENERPRLDSLASTSASSGPSSASATSSQYNLSPIAPSFAGTTLTTPTTGGIVSPTSSGTTGPPWSHEYDHAIGGGRFSVDQQSAPLPLSPIVSSSSHVLKEMDAEATTAIKVLQEHLDNTNKMWQKRVWDLENEVRMLKNELGGLKPQKHNDGCEKCGRGGIGIPPVPPLPSKSQQQQTLRSEGGGIMNRPRAKTGSSARFVNAQI